MPERLLTAAERLRGICIRSVDALKLIDDYDTADCLLFVDPPYPGDVGRRYAVRMTDESHRALARSIARIPLSRLRPEELDGRSVATVPASPVRRRSTGSCQWGSDERRASCGRVVGGDADAPPRSAPAADHGRAQSVILAAALSLGTMAACTPSLTVEVEPGQLSPTDTAEPIAQDTAIFTVIEHIDGDKLTLRLLHSVMSAHADTILFVGDEIHVALEPLLPQNSRRGGCVTAILGRQGQGMGRIVPGTDSGRHPACLAGLQDFRGTEGLPVHDIHLNQVVRVMLTGDLVFDGQGVTAPIIRCDEFQSWSADFLKKTWQPFKPADGKTSNTCEFDGDPRPMEQRACRLGNTPGAHWGFTDPSGRWVQVSACVSAITAE